MTANSITRKYKKLRDSARGEDCTLRIHPYCNGNPETTVLCHLPSGSGMGQKSPDWFAVYGCSSCHDIIDGRVTDPQIRIMLGRTEHGELVMPALYRTWEIMIEKGLIKL